MLLKLLPAAPKAIAAFFPCCSRCCKLEAPQPPFFQSRSRLAAWEVPLAALHTYKLMCCALTT